MSGPPEFIELNSPENQQSSWISGDTQELE